MTTNELPIVVTIGDYQNQLLPLLGLWSFEREEREKVMIQSVHYGSEHSAVRLFVRGTRLEVERGGRIDKGQELKMFFHKSEK